MIRFHNEVQGKQMTMLYESDLVLVFRRGDCGIVAINKGGDHASVEFSTYDLKNPSLYKDLINDNQMTLSGDRFTLSINPRTAQMWLAGKFPGVDEIS